MKKLYITLFGIMVLAFPNVVNALGIDKTEVSLEPGGTATLSITDWVEGYTATWTSDNTNYVTVDHEGQSVTITGVAPGTTAVSIIVKNAEGEEVNADPFKCDVVVSSPKSNDATLKSLAVTDYELSPKFDKDTLEYKVTVPEKTEKVTITGATNHDKAKVDGLKEITLDKDSVTAKVVVTAEDEKATKTYTITIEKEKKEEPKEVKDFTLKTLDINGGSIEPKFDKDTFEYTLTIADTNDLSKLSVKATANDKNAEVVISGYSSLSVIEKNGIKITVTDSSKSCKDPNAEGAKCKVYTLKLPKKEYSVNLSKLEVVTYPFEEVFSKDVTKYTTTIPYEVEEITLNAIPEDSSATVTNTSLKGLKVGTNQIVVTVKNGDKKKDYIIYVTRSKEEKLDEKSTSIITGSNKDSKSKNSDYDIPDVDNPDSALNFITVTLASLMLFAAGVIGIIFFIKTSPKRLKKEALNKQNNKKASPLVEAAPKLDVIEEIELDEDKK